jgi:MSHA biogenesis protein MshO
MHQFCSQSRAAARRPAPGFTLVEIVVTLVIASILVIGTFRFIGNSVDGFVVSSNRNQLASAGRLALDRMALELQTALPNSVRVAQDGQCLEFIPVVAATTYLDPDFADDSASALAHFHAVVFNPPLLLEAPEQTYAAIYPAFTDELYQPVSSSSPLALLGEGGISAVDGERVLISLDAPHLFPRRSPVDRLYIVEQPVSFCVVGPRLYRYSNYGLGNCDPAVPACLPQDAAAGRQLIANQLSESPEAFAVLAPTLRRNSLVTFNLNFRDGNDSFSMSHEVLLRNTP